jgi:hypothetical protein
MPFCFQDENCFLHDYGTFTIMVHLSTKMIGKALILIFFNFSSSYPQLAINYDFQIDSNFPPFSIDKVFVVTPIKPIAILFYQVFTYYINYILNPI